MPTQQKIDRVQDIKDRLERSTIAMTANYSGITVNEMVELRRAMRNGGVDFTIVKNSLLFLAAEGANKPQMKEIVQGPTAIALGYDDPVDAARTMADYIRTGRSALVILGAVMGDGAAMSPDEFTKLASLPPRAQLLAMLLGQMQSPIARLLSVLNGPLQALDNVLQARVRQMEAEAPPPEPESGPGPESAAEPDTAEATGEAEESPVDAAPASDTEDASAEASEPEPEPAAEEAPAEEPEAEVEPEAEPAAEEAPAEEPDAEVEPEAEPAAEEAPAEEPETEANAETAGDDERE